MAEQREPKTLRELLADLDAQGITDYRRYERVRRFLNFKAREKGVPISGSFELTPLCNLDCKMCYVHLNKEQMKGAQLLSVEQWKDIMQQAVDAGMMYASLTGGECLTYPGFKELYLFLRERGVEVTILSNGLLMNEEMTGFLRENPPATIQITLYGASDDSYERVTGKRTFQIVTENMHHLKMTGLPLLITVTPNAFMTDGVQVLDYLHENKYPYQLNAGLMTPRVETGRAVYDAELGDRISLFKMLRSQKRISLDVESNPDGLPEAIYRNKGKRFGVTCAAGRSAFCVDWQGAMRPCNTFPCAGVSVAQLGFEEAWRQVKQTASQFPLPIECNGCAYEGNCKHCVAEHASGAEIGHANPAICAWRKRMHIEGLMK